MEDRTRNSVEFRILHIIDEFTRKCLAVRVGRSLTHQTVIEVLTELFVERGVPVHFRSDNGSGFTALAEATGCQTAVHRARQSLGKWLH